LEDGNKSIAHYVWTASFASASCSAFTGASAALTGTSGSTPVHSPPWAGVLSSAGGLVFSGSDEGNFYALDARNGKVLWDFQTAGAIGANPIALSIAVLQSARSASYMYSDYNVQDHTTNQQPEFPDLSRRRLSASL
jgi:outer membrane protein assembly factor BamB